MSTSIPVGLSLKAKNNALAEENRALFLARGVHVVNVLSSPGAGKTALLERTLGDMKDRLRGAVIVGDLATDNDARRLQRSGAPAVQITTGNTCHLDAAMIHRALAELNLELLDLLFIENVGNLVCPATWDLGEALRVVLFSVPEGEDKPAKYPLAFRSADLIILSKTDLLEATGFDRNQALAAIGSVAPRTPVIELSTRSGAGLNEWYDFLLSRAHA